MHFDRRVAVLQRIFLGHGAERQLALLAHGYETQIEFISQHAAHDEAARVHAGHQVQALAHVAVDEKIDQHPERARILQHGRDVAKYDTGLGPVWNAADGAPDVLGVVGLHGRRP
ncbi:hypothetical protein D3C78_1513420 [compost metagenome]